MTKTWQPVTRMEWDCPCSSCVADDKTSWTWRGEYWQDAEGNCELEVICKEDSDDYRAIELPPGYAICRLEEATNG